MHTWQVKAQHNATGVRPEAGAPTPIHPPGGHRQPLWAGVYGDRPPGNVFGPTEGIQAKLMVGPPADVYEQEADRVAAQVMRMPDPVAPVLQRQCACGEVAGPDGECAACRAKRLGLQRAASMPAVSTTAPPIVHDVLHTPGQPLDAHTRAFMEPRLGQNFGAVRVHTDAQAAESARAVNALAYTVGRDVIFGAGQYTPGTRQGNQLLAHELTHVIQQRASRPAVGLQRTFTPADLLSAATPPTNPIAANPDTYFYHGSANNPTGRRALVIAGIHGSEPSARALGLEAQQQLNSGTMTTDFHTIIIPQVNPAPAGERAAGQGTRGFVPDLNREFGTGYASPSPLASRVTTVVNEFDPERILSIHAISNATLGGIFLDPIHARLPRRPGETEREVDLRSYPPVGTGAERRAAFTGDVRNLAAMQLTDAMIAATSGQTPGNTVRSGFPASQYPGSTGGASPSSLIYPLQGRMSGGVSLGVWGSGLGKATVTIEIPGYTAAASVWRAFLPAIREFLRIPAPPSPTRSTPTSVTSPSPDAGANLQRSPAPRDAIRQHASEPILQRQDSIAVDLVPVDPAESTRLHQQGINLPQVSPVTWRLIGGDPTDQAILRDIRALTTPARRLFLTGQLSRTDSLYARIERQINAQIAELNRLRPRQLPTITIASYVRGFGPDTDSHGGQATILFEKFTLTGSRRNGWDTLPDLYFVGGQRSAGVDRRRWLDEAPARRLDIILRYTAVPGASRHHWGTDVDFNSTTNSEWEPATSGRSAGRFFPLRQWLEGNAHRAGFVRSYTEGRTGGHSDEPWHYSYAPLSGAMRTMFNTDVRIPDDVVDPLLAYFHTTARAQGIPLHRDLDSALRGMDISQYVNIIGPGL